MPGRRSPSSRSAGRRAKWCSPSDKGDSPAVDLLGEVRARHALLDDSARPEAVRRRHEQGRRTGLELGRAHAAGMITALARIEGPPVGVLANNSAHLAGAIRGEGADKAARFLEFCEKFRFPVISLIDTPGIMVGPEAEATGLVRPAGRLFTAEAKLTVPHGAVILRKAYGLGAQAMAGGSLLAPLLAPLLTVAWLADR